MKYLSKLLPVIVVLAALGGAIYYVLSSEPPRPLAPSQQNAAATHKSLVPPSYTQHSPS